MPYQILPNYLTYNTPLGGSSSNNGVTGISVTGFSTQSGAIGFSGINNVIVSTGNGNFIYFGNNYNDPLNLSGLVVFKTGAQGISGIKTFGDIILAGLSDISAGQRAATDSFVVKGSSAGGQIAWFYDFNSVQPYIGIEGSDNTWAVFGNRAGSHTFIYYSTSTGRAQVENVWGYPGNLVAGKVGLCGPNSIGHAFLDPTAYLHLGDGGAGVGLAPLKFTSGLFLVTPEKGSVEYNGKNLYLTNDAGNGLGGFNREVIATGRVISTLTTGTDGFGNTLVSGDIVVSGQGSNYISLNNNILIISGATNNWEKLTCETTTQWNVNRFTTEDRRKLYMTGNTILSINNLYNGWNGLLQTIQSGNSSDGYSLSLPASTKVSNGGGGIINLTSGSGSIDMINIKYDGSFLFAKIDANFT